MYLVQTDEGFALYKEKDPIGRCAAAVQGGEVHLSGLWMDPAWRRRGYGSYLLRQVLHRLGGYDRESASCFTAPLPAGAGEAAFWAKFDFHPEGDRLVRRRKPDLSAVRLAQDFLAAHLVRPRLLIDATCGNGGDTAFLCRLAGEEGRVLAFDIQPAALASTRARLAREGIPEGRCRLILDSHAHLPAYVQPGAADGIMFNFGWLPGADHTVHRGGHRGQRKTGRPGLAGRAAPDQVYRPGLPLCQLGRYRAAALFRDKKVVLPLAQGTVLA